MPIVSLLELSEAWPCFLPERRYLVQQDKKKHTKKTELQKSVGSEIEEISKVFNSFEISYIPRNANLAAHYCDKEASPCNPECMWIG
jgi:hypothetical protein